MKGNPSMTAVRQARSDQHNRPKQARLMRDASKKKLTEYLISWIVWKGESDMQCKLNKERNSQLLTPGNKK